MELEKATRDQRLALKNEMLRAWEFAEKETGLTGERAIPSLKAAIDALPDLGPETYRTMAVARDIMEAVLDRIAANDAQA